MNNQLENLDANPILKKTLDFAITIVRYCKILKYEYKEYELAKQLIRSGTSIGANANEAVIASSKKDFTNKMNIKVHPVKSFL
jgi:four helix bundle protein